MEQAIAFLRVTSGAIKPHTFISQLSKIAPAQGEVMDFKATGYWDWYPGIDASIGMDPEPFAMSLHFSVPVGIDLVPPTGDFLKITVERATSEEIQAQQLRKSPQQLMTDERRKQFALEAK